MRVKTQLKKIVSFSKGTQINGDDLIENGKYDYLNGGITPSGKWNQFNTPGGTVTISEGGNSRGYVNYFRRPFWCGAHCYYLFDPIINTEYLYYMLKSQQDRLMKIRTGACMPNIKKGDLGNFELEYDPNIENQTHVVFIMKRVEAVIAARQQQLSALDDLIKARFVEMFGDPETNPKEWEKKPLVDVITIANNGMARRGNDADGNIVMRLVELQDGYIDYSNPNRIILTDAEKKRYLLKDKDFLFARVNGNPENVGRCAVFYDIGEPVFHNDHIIRVHFNDDAIDGSFASALLNSEYGKRQLRNQIKTSAGQYTVSQDGIGAIITILPPISLQKTFAYFVAQVDNSKATVQKALDEAQVLFDSLMQQYFG